MTEELGTLPKREVLKNAKSFEHVFTSKNGGIEVKLTTYPEGKQPNNWWYKLGLSRSETTVIKNEAGEDIYHHKVRVGIITMEFNEGFFESIAAEYPGQFKSEPKF